METTDQNHEVKETEFVVEEQFKGLASDALLKVYQSIFNSVKEISRHLRYSTGKCKRVKHLI